MFPAFGLIESLVDSSARLRVIAMGILADALQHLLRPTQDNMAQTLLMKRDGIG